MKGFSRTNLKYMRMFAQAYPEFGQQPVDQLPWGHNTVLITKVKDPTMRQWYVRACIEHGWLRAVLVHQIESNLYERQGQALTNFEQALPAPHSEFRILRCSALLVAFRKSRYTPCDTCK